MSAEIEEERRLPYVAMMRENDLHLIAMATTARVKYRDPDNPVGPAMTRI